MFTYSCSCFCPLQPCKVVCPQDVDLMYTELIQRCKQMYLTESDRDDDNIYQLPSFLDSIASVLVHLDKVQRLDTTFHSVHHLYGGQVLMHRPLTHLKLLMPNCRFLRSTLLSWSGSWWSKLTASPSTASGCSTPPAEPLSRCLLPWQPRVQCCGALSVLLVRRRVGQYGEESWHQTPETLVRRWREIIQRIMAKRVRSSAETFRRR